MVVQEWGQETKYYHQSPCYFLYQGDKKKTQKHGKAGKCFGGIPMGTLRKVTDLVEAVSRAGKEGRNRQGVRKCS